MPDQLVEHLPFLDEATRMKLYGSLHAAAQYPRGHPIREGVIAAYDYTMKYLCIAATVFAVPPLIMSFFMPNFYLGDAQNAVDGVGLAGDRVEGAQDAAEKESVEKSEKV